MILLVHIWSDIACPWCYVGQKRLLIAAQNLEVELAIEWHSFELDRAPLKAGDSRDHVQRLADKYGRTRAQAQSMMDQMTRTGAEVGIQFHFEKLISANTFLAHRLLHLAKKSSLALQWELKRSFLDAYFTDGKDLNDEATLLSLISSVGMDVDAASSLFSSDEFSQDVRDDEQLANEIGITGVPFFVIGKQGVAGAQQPETFERVLLQALAEKDEEEDGVNEGAVCTPDGC
jgi:predicted DsbA family dithiol-disulfide isomerase